MGYIKEYFELVRDSFPGKNLYNDFMLAHGVEYGIGPKTFEGPRMEAQACFQNATHLTIYDGLTYVEGKVSIYGVCIDHAWCIDADGNLIEPTLMPDEEGKEPRILGYMGVPFRTDYLKRALLINRCYGLLDYFHARETVPKLYELGLDAGQQWLLDQPKRLLRRRKRRAA